MQAPPRLRRMSRRLGFQIAFLLAIVLLPLALLSAIRSADLVAEARARSEAAFLGETVVSAAAEWRIIREAAGMTTALAIAVPGRMSDQRACSDLFAALIRVKSFVSFAGFVPPGGVIDCSSARRRIDVSHRPRHRDIAAAREPRVFVNPDASITGEPALTLTSPVTDAAGNALGYVAMSIPMSLLQSPREGEGAVPVVTFSAQGDILLARPDGGAAARMLPNDRALRALAGAEPVAFTATDVAGTERVYSVIPLIPGQVYALGSRPAENDGPASLWLTSMPVVAPAVMWVASLAVAILAVNQLVIRNVARLSRVIRDFAGGARTVGAVNLDRAPEELAEIGEALETMMDNVIRDEAELEDTIHQREVLLREVHHRVKNNLQLVASIMNLQIRRVDSPELRRILVNLQDRILGLASVHRELFQTSGLADVHADELLGGIILNLQSRLDAAGNGYDIVREIDPIRMTPDQAVPLALLATEALGNAMRHAAMTGHRTRRIDFRLRQDGVGMVRLEIVNAINLTPDLFGHSEPVAGLGTHLIAGFAQQLRATVERISRDGRYRLRVRFPLTALAEAEQRRQG